MKRILLGVAAVAALVSAGCGNSDDAGATGGDAGATGTGTMRTDETGAGGSGMGDMGADTAGGAGAGTGGLGVGTTTR
ncbi:MAG TPA: hypothetical protein VM328_13965 [Fimbriimonadaceae bacterium]|nr:hypothetical protein [Fimbriimonadaceae bacterium]